MKKRTHKILSWLLTIAMVLGLLPAMSLPAAAAEETFVTHVDLQMEAPKDGMTAAQYAATVGIDNQHPRSYGVLQVSEVNCYRIDDYSFLQVGKDLSSFVEGGVYQCLVKVTLSDTGYSFAHFDSDMTVLVNGQTLDNYDYDRENGYAADYDNREDYLIYSVYFTATAADPVGEGITITSYTGDKSLSNGWSYVKSSNTLTLNGYQGGGIAVSGIPALNLVLTNNTYNAITVNGTIDVYGIGSGTSTNVPLNISGGGTLVMNLTNTTASRPIYGIRGNKITQTGGKVFINADSAAGAVYGVYGQSGVSITGGTLTVDATVQSATECYGIYAVTDEIRVGSGAEVNVTIRNVGGGNYVWGIYNEARDVAGSLANNGSITLNGKVSVTRAANSAGAVHGIMNANTTYNTSGVISVGSGANVTLTDTNYGIASYTRYQAGLAGVSITGGTVNITSTYSDSYGIYSGYNGVSITGGTVTVNTDAVALNLGSGNNENGIIRIGGSAVVNLTSDNSYAVYTRDNASSTRVHTLDFTSSTGSFTAKSNQSSYQSIPVRAYFQLGTNTYLSEGIASGYNEAGTGRMFSSGTLNRVKVSYKQANAHPDCGAVKVNGCYFGVSTLYYKNGASSTYDGADGVWNAHYDPTTGVLELKNYAGGPIEIGGANPTVVELKLTGANTITANQPNIATGNYCAGVKIANADTVTVTGDGSLTVNVNAGGDIWFAHGIYLNSTSNALSDLTIQSGTVDLNIQYTGSYTAPYAVGIYTGESANRSGKVTVGADAAVHAAVTSGQYGSSAKGIWAKGDVALNGETSLHLTCSGAGTPGNYWTSVTTNGSITIGDGASVRVDMPTGRSYGLSSALLAAADGNTVEGVRWIHNDAYKTSENETFRMVATDRGNGLYADFDYMSKSGATAVEGITVTAAETALSANGTTTVTAAVTPEDATYPGVLWSSGNPDVTVDTYGKVTAGLEVQPNPGKAVLTATSKYDTSVTGSTAITVGTPDSSKIYEVFAQVPAPVVDEIPATAEEVDVGEGFSVRDVIWRCRADETSEWGSLSGDTFKEGMLYQVEVDIQELSDTKDYADANRMAAYINGKAVPVTSIYGSTDYKIASVYCTFGKAAADSSGGVKPDANFVTIDGGKPFAAPNQLCFKNGGAATTTDSSSYNAKYDPSTGVLELRNYNGGPIEIGGSVEADITIKLVGDNVITSSGQFGIVNHHGGDITITADSNATLTINVTNAAQEAIGIACDRTESYPGCSRAITIGGKAQVTVNATSTDAGDIRTAAGLRTPGTVTIQDNASFKAVCKSATPSIGVQAGVGILAYRGVTIDTTGTVEIDVSDCTSIGTFAIYGSAANALTKVGSMTLKWKQDGVNGGMLYPAGSFDSAAATHAVNVDTPNRVATYRYGTPYTVTVNNGSCDAVGRQYLAGDTVTVKARTIEGLAFTKWTSKDVTIANATSPTATFTMPAQDVTVTADFGAFAVPPVFTLTNEGRGNIAFTMVNAPSNRPKLVQAGSEEVYNNYYFDYDTNYSCSIDVMESNVPAGEYQIAVQYSDIWLYSDVFTVSYAGTPQATVSNQTVSGTRNQMLLNPVYVNISLVFDTFQSVAVNDDVGSWFTNLPAGLTAVIYNLGSDGKTVTVRINGTPTQVKNEAMAITIPGEKLTSGAALAVTPNDNAKFEIAESEYALTNFELSAAVNGLEALASYGSITAAPEEAHSGKYDIVVLNVTPEAELGTADVADPGEQLKLTVGVAAKAPYLLEDADLDSLTIQVGGHTAKPKTIYYGGGYAHESVEKNGVWYWVFVVPDAFTVPAYTFSEIDFALDSVEEGGHPDMTADVTGSGTLPFSKMNTSIEWTDLGTNGSGNTAMTASSTFQNGHYYECRVRFTTSDPTNYKFPEAGNMTITANGKTIPETMSSPYESPLVSCFAYGIDYETNSACYTVYLRFNIGNGSTVSGTVTSYGSASEAVTVTLLQGTSEVATKTLTGASGTVPYSQSYAFLTVPAGEYTLKVEKTGHAPFSKVISVGGNHVTENVTIYLIGDVNRDGKIDADDVTALLRHVSGIEMLSSSAVALGDVNGDSNIDADDVTKLLRYVSGIIPNLN